MKDLINKLLNQLTKIRADVLQYTDPVMLLFLFFITNYRFSFKIFAIIAIYYYRPDFKFKKSGILYFYTGIIALSIFHLFAISGDLSINHIATVLTSCAIWAVCLLTFHQLQLFVAKNSADKIIYTLKALAITNLIFSLFDLVRIMLVTHTINPYSQISPPPYGISSGDLIGGVFGEMHLVNMSISAFLLLLFLYQKNLLFSFITVLPLLLTGSNLGTIITLAAILFILITKRDLLIKYYVLIITAFIVIFYIKITPENLKYFNKSIDKIFSKGISQPVLVTTSNNKVLPLKKTEEEIKNEKIHNYLAVKNGDHFKAKVDTVYFLKLKHSKSEKELKIKRDNYTHYVKDSLQMAKEKDKRFEFGKLKKFDFNKTSGKITSFKQVKDFLMSDWKNFLFGSGTGGFSSRIAFISSGIVDDSRILMALPKYENPEFTKNHKAIFKYLLFLDDEYHSITNLPFSWYNELIGEYGLLGTLLFIIFYLGFFFKRFRMFSYGKILLLVILAFFLFDYWYQRLSVMVLFELIMLLDLKINSEKTNKLEHGN